MICPLCDVEAGRGEVHAHLAAAHADAVETWVDAKTQKMRYRVECPQCGAAHEHSVKPRFRDPAFLEEFAAEIRLVAFDMLLNHVEAEHGDPVPSAERAEGEDARSALPTFGPAGGRGRPGAGGLPLPPGMDEPEPTVAERVARHLSVTHVKPEPRGSEN